MSTAKGTSSFGKRHNKTHVLCRRCGMNALGRIKSYEQDTNTTSKVVALCTCRSTLAPTAVTLAHPSGSVRRTPPSFSPPIPEQFFDNISLGRRKETLLTSYHRQLGREGQEEKDHWFRPHAVPQDRQPQVHQRLPDWRAQGCPWRQVHLSDSSLCKLVEHSAGA